MPFPYTSLREFLTDLEASGELVRVRAEVDPALEAPTIAIRRKREGGPALLFENVRGARAPLLMNLFSTPARVTRAIGVEPVELGARLHAAAASMMPPSPSNIVRGAWTARSLAPRVLSMFTYSAWRPPVCDIQDAPNLDALPIITCWPEDGGRFITYGQVITRGPRSGSINVGVYRMQVFARDLTGMHIQIERGGGGHLAEAMELGHESLPVAVSIGSDPAMLLSAIAPLPEGMSEFAFSGFLRGRPLGVTHVGPAQLPVPATAEIVLVGSVPVHERRREGPFGDHFGHYSAASDFPVFRVDRVLHRRDPIYHATVVGKPPQEDQVLGDAVQEVTGPMLPLLHHTIRSVWAYYQAGFHNLLGVQVHERYPREALKAAFGVLGQGQLSLSKVIVLVGPDVDPRDPCALLRAIRAHADPREDVHILGETALDTLDFTSYRMHRGSKLVIDAVARDETRRDMWAAPPNAGALSLDALRVHAPQITRARLVEDALLVVQAPRDGRAVLEALLAALPPDAVPLVAIVSDDVNLDDRTELIWGITTRFDAARDVLFSRTTLAGATAQHDGILGIDATWKPGYQPPLVMTPDIERRVDARWREYFP